MNESCSLVSSDKTGACDGSISLFEEVVSISRDCIWGRRLNSCSLRSEMWMEASTGSERVDGSPRPGKDVRRMLTVLEHIAPMFWLEVDKETFLPQYLWSVVDEVSNVR